MTALDDLIRAVEAAGPYRMPRASDMPSALRPVDCITTDCTTLLTPETVSAAGTGAFLRAVQAKQQGGADG